MLRGETQKTISLQLHSSIQNEAVIGNMEATVAKNVLLLGEGGWHSEVNLDWGKDWGPKQW